MQKIARDPHEPGPFLKVVLNVSAIGIFVAVVLGVLLFAFVDVVTGNLIGAIIPLLLLGYAIYWVVRRGFEMRRLATEGVETTGTVTDKLLYRRTRRQIKYVYQDQFGRKHRGASLVSCELFDNLAAGSPVKIVYLPGRPSVSALFSDVENVRRVSRAKPDRASA